MASRLRAGGVAGRVDAEDRHSQTWPNADVWAGRDAGAIEVLGGCCGRRPGNSSRRSWACWCRCCAAYNELTLTDAEAALLVRISAATIDRRLAHERAKLISRGRSHTKPGTLLKSQIPIRTWADWDDAIPGFVEIDLVGHEGGNAPGKHCFILTVTDIATGWTVNRSVQNKAEKWVFEALMHITRVFPFPIIGIDSDNGPSSSTITCSTTVWPTRSPSPGPAPATATAAPTSSRRTGHTCVNSSATCVTTLPPSSPC